MSEQESKDARVAARMSHIAPFHVMDILARAKAMEAAGRDIIHMEVGEPDFTTPQAIIDAGIRALQQGKTHYTPALGLAELRQAIAADYQQRYAVSIDPARIVITPGASGALMLALGVLVNAGDQVMLADPGYPCNRHFIRLFDGEPISVAVDAQHHYQLSADQIKAHWSERCVAAMLATPSNPTGTLITAEQWPAIIATLAEFNGRLLVDEIYQGLNYESELTSVLQYTDEAFVINSFSKYYGMTGWRLGWLVAPPAYLPALDRLAQNIFLAPSTPAQYAALAAFTPATERVLQQRRDEFRQRRDYLLPALRQLGFIIPVQPQGAFYLYADCSRFTDDSYAFVLEVLEQSGVAMTPGVDFGDYRARQHVRFAYTTSLEKLQQGVARLAEFLV